MERRDASANRRDIEAMAALIDQRLEADERRDLLTRLDREPALYEVFVEAVRHRGLEPESVRRAYGLRRRPGGWLRRFWRSQR